MGAGVNATILSETLYVISLVEKLIGSLYMFIVTDKARARKGGRFCAFIITEKARA